MCPEAFTQMHYVVDRVGGWILGDGTCVCRQTLLFCTLVLSMWQEYLGHIEEEIRFKLNSRVLRCVSFHYRAEASSIDSAKHKRQAGSQIERDY